MTTKAMPLSGGISRKNARIASRPPADAPMAAMHGDAGRCARGASLRGARLGRLLMALRTGLRLGRLVADAINAGRQFS